MQTPKKMLILKQKLLLTSGWSGRVHLYRSVIILSLGRVRMGKFVIYHWVEVEEYLFRGHLFGSGWLRLQSVIDYWRRVGEYFIVCQLLIRG